MLGIDLSTAIILWNDIIMVSHTLHHHFHETPSFNERALDDSSSHPGKLTEQSASLQMLLRFWTKWSNFHGFPDVFLAPSSLSSGHAIRHSRCDEEAIEIPGLVLCQFSWFMGQWWSAFLISNIYILYTHMCIYTIYHVVYTVYTYLYIYIKYGYDMV